jgi:hypothetical protein
VIGAALPICFTHVDEKPKIDSRVRAKLEELGVDVVRSKLVWIMNVTTLGQQENLESLFWDP